MSREHGPECPSCHCALTVPTRYCTSCGAWLDTMANDALLPPPPSSAGPSRPCPRCAYPAVLDGNFCANCGHRLNEAPLTRAEAKMRRWQAEEAAKPSRSLADQDRSTIRGGWIAIVVCSLLLIVDVFFLVSDPANATFLGPIAALLVLHAPVWLSAFNRARGRQHQRRHAPVPPPAAPTSSPPRSSASSGGP